MSAPVKIVFFSVFQTWSGPWGQDLRPDGLGLDNILVILGLPGIFENDYVSKIIFDWW